MWPDDAHHGHYGMVESMCCRARVGEVFRISVFKGRGDELLIFAGNDLFFLRHRYHRYRLHFDMGHLITYFFHKRRYVIGVFSILCKIYKSVKSMLRQARFHRLKLIQDALKVIVKYILKLGYRCLDVIHLINLELHFRNFRWWHHQNSYSQVSFNSQTGCSD
jgi:hypothetical protein